MHSPHTPSPAFLPASYPRAAARAALRGRCPRCGEAGLFRKWLKPVDSCPGCGQDWSIQSADDFPAYVSIFVTGHLVVPLMILLLFDYRFSALAAAAIILPLAVVTMVGVLQPAKGAIIAAQWWLGLAGFRRERPDGADEA